MNEHDLERSAASKHQRVRAQLIVQLAHIDAQIAAVRTQIATADFRRQSGRQSLDPDWFHRSKTALSHLRRERAELEAQLSGSPCLKDRLKDRIIDLVRSDYSEERWAQVVAQARAGLGAEGQ